jgi:two-component system chemotaxis response regulator CheY
MKLEQYSCLVVEDHPEIRQSIVFFLKNLGIFKYIVEAENGIDATAKLENQEFNIIICDNNIPKKRGIDLIRHSIEIKNIPKDVFILISGELSSDDASVFLNYGIKHILVKPFSFKQLDQKIGQILGIP